MMMSFDSFQTTTSLRHRPNTAKFLQSNSHGTSRQRTGHSVRVMAAGSSYGHMFRVTTFGESHGGGCGCIVDGTWNRRLVVSSSRRLVVSSSRRLVVWSSRRLVVSTAVQRLQREACGVKRAASVCCRIDHFGWELSAPQTVAVVLAGTTRVGRHDTARGIRAHSLRGTGSLIRSFVRSFVRSYDLSSTLRQSAGGQIGVGILRISLLCAFAFIITSLSPSVPSSDRAVPTGGEKEREFHPQILSSPPIS